MRKRIEDTPLRLFPEGFSFSDRYEKQLAKSEQRPSCYCGRGSARDLDMLFRLGNYDKSKGDQVDIKKQ